MKLNKFIPKIYKKSVLDINYSKLKEQGIKYILFDLDNTLIETKNKKVDVKIIELLEKLNKEFKIIIVTNNFKRKIKIICDIIDIDYISFSMKPCTFKLKKMLKKYNINCKEVCIIGDQLISDILVGNKLNFMTIFIDPLSTKDLNVTKFNRFLEQKIINRLSKEKILERGNYYEER